jgi:hypothetical protein
MSRSATRATCNPVTGTSFLHPGLAPRAILQLSKQTSAPSSCGAGDNRRLSFCSSTSPRPRYNCSIIGIRPRFLLYVPFAARFPSPDRRSWAVIPRAPAFAHHPPRLIPRYFFAPCKLLAALFASLADLLSLRCGRVPVHMDSPFVGTARINPPLSRPSSGSPPNFQANELGHPQIGTLVRH